MNVAFGGRTKELARKLVAEREGDSNRPKGGRNLRDAEWPRRKYHDG